jgi:hypothetical protein
MCTGETSMMLFYSLDVHGVLQPALVVQNIPPLIKNSLNSLKSYFGLFGKSSLKIKKSLKNSLKRYFGYFGKSNLKIILKACSTQSNRALVARFLE